MLQNENSEVFNRFYYLSSSLTFLNGDSVKKVFPDQHSF